MLGTVPYLQTSPYLILNGPVRYVLIALPILQRKQLKPREAKLLAKTAQLTRENSTPALLNSKAHAFYHHMLCRVSLYPLQNTLSYFFFYPTFHSINIWFSLTSSNLGSRSNFQQTHAIPRCYFPSGGASKPSGRQRKQHGKSCPKSFRTSPLNPQSLCLGTIFSALGFTNL